MTHTLKGLLILLTVVMVVIVSTTYAFASENPPLSSQLGEGSGMASGYSVTNIAYHLNADPTSIDSISFTLDSAAAIVKIGINNTASPWFNCSNVISNDWICQTVGVTTLSVEILRVIATNNK